MYAMSCLILPSLIDIEGLLQSRSGARRNKCFERRAMWFLVCFVLSCE